MKLGAAQLRGFIDQPPATIAAVLIYGPDEGLVRERGEAITHAVLGGSTDDPFRLSNLTADQIRQDPARLSDEARAMSLIGGRRVVRVRDAGDALSKPLATVLDGPATDSLIVLEAGDLGKASSLRKLAECAANIATIACYMDGPKEIGQLVREMLSARQIQISDEAVQYLVPYLGGDRGMTRQEIEKLTLAVGDGGKVTLAEAIASIGDTSALAVEDVIYDAFEGRGSSVEAALTRLFNQGEAAVSILRATQRQLHKLHLCLIDIAQGGNAESAMRKLRPPIFFRYEPRFRQLLGVWTAEHCEKVLSRLTTAELQCKTTGMPDEVICRHVITSLRSGLRRAGSA